MAGLPLRHFAHHSSRRHRRCAARLYRIVRRLRYHQSGGGSRFGNVAHGNLRYRTTRRESGGQRDLGADRVRTRGVDLDLRAREESMNRRTFLLGGAALAGCARDRRPRLNVFNWSDYIDPRTVPKFEAEHDVRVRYGIYESNEEMLARVFGGNSGWDIVFPTDYIVGPLRSQNL